MTSRIYVASAGIRRDGENFDTWWQEYRSAYRTVIVADLIAAAERLGGDETLTVTVRVAP